MRARRYNLFPCSPLGGQETGRAELLKTAQTLALDCPERTIHSFAVFGRNVGLYALASEVRKRGKNVNGDKMLLRCLKDRIIDRVNSRKKIYFIT